MYEGFQAYPLADGDTNENVIGNGAIGHGSNTTTLGNSSITDTYLAGIVHGTSFTGNAATATTAAALSVPLAHAIIFPDPNAGAVYTASQVLGTFFSPMAGTVPAGGAGTLQRGSGYQLLPSQHGGNGLDHIHVRGWRHELRHGSFRGLWHNRHVHNFEREVCIFR